MASLDIEGGGQNCGMQQQMSDAFLSMHDFAMWALGVAAAKSSSISGGSILKRQQISV